MASIEITAHAMDEIQGELVAQGIEVVDLKDAYCTFRLTGPREALESALLLHWGYDEEGMEAEWAEVQAHII